MIEVLQQALRHPGEWILLGLAAVGALPALLLARRRFAWLPLVALLVGLGAAAAVWREIDAASVHAISSLRGSMLSGHVASQHAAAASVLWWSSLLGAVLCALAAWRAPERVGSAREPVFLAPSLGGALVGLLGAVAGVPGAVWAGLVGASGALARSAPGAAAIALSAFATGAASEAELHRALALTDLAQLDAQLPLWWARGALVSAAVGWVAAAVPAARRVGVAWLVAPAVAAALITGAWLPRWHAARIWGPAPELAGQGSDAPVHHPRQAWRWTGGCAWRPTGDGWTGHDWGMPSERHLSPPCVGAAPDLANRPTLLLDADQPLALLDGLGAPGEVNLLVRLDPDPGPPSLEPWRWATETLVVAVPPDDPRADPRWALRQDTLLIRGALPESLPPVPALDLVMVATPDLTVADALRRCAQGRKLNSFALRCVVGVGEWGGAG